LEIAIAPGAVRIGEKIRVQLSREKPE